MRLNNTMDDDEDSKRDNGDGLKEHQAKKMQSHPKVMHLNEDGFPSMKTTRQFRIRMHRLVWVVNLCR